MFKFRFLVFVLPFSLMGLTITTSPAQAIFGLSKCEKIQKQIYSELSIGNLLFKSYESEVKSALTLFDSNKLEYYKRTSSLIDLLTLITKSDVNAYKMASNHSECYSAQQTRDLRYILQKFENMYKGIIEATKKSSYLDWKFNEIYNGRFPNSKYLKMKK